MAVGSQELTGLQARTRAAILAATASVLARDRTATLAEIAAAAGVGRSTVHRYFADRDRLIHQAMLDSIRVVDECIATAATESGPAGEAMRRLITTLVPEGDRIVLLFSDPGVLRDIPADQRPNSGPITELIRRGQREGAFDGELSADWIRIALFGLLIKACREAAYGTVSRRDIVTSLTRIFERGVVSP